MTAILGKLAPGLIAKLNLCTDLLLLMFAMFVAFSPSIHGLGALEIIAASWTTLTAALIWFVVALVARYYDPWISRDDFDDAALASVLIIAVTGFLAFSSIVMPASVPVAKIGLFMLVFWPLVVGTRVVLFRPRYANEGPLDEVLVVGINTLGRLTGEDLAGRRRIVGYVKLANEELKSGLPAPFLGEAQDLESVLKNYPINEVYIAGKVTSQGDAMQVAISTCERLGIPFALPAHAFRFERAQPLMSKAVADGYMHYLSVGAKPHQMAVKRLFDVVSSAAALWMLSPLLVGVAAVIKLTSRGPVLFKQTRVGLHGKTFSMFKFRSMVVNAEELKEKLMAANEQSGPVFKMKRDPRITTIGRFIRKYSIDELPQLINVLRGDMSIVGPRPPVPQEVAKYETWQRRRLSVRPGLTCIWQVSGRNEISFNDWMYLDMRYVDNWSLKEDIGLILRTVPVVLTGRGAS